MGRKDYRKREHKKGKKGSNKTTTISFEPQETIEVIKKGKKLSDSQEE